MAFLFSLYIIFSLLGTSTVFAQKKKELYDLLEAADAHYAMQHFHQASSFYEKAVEIDPENAYAGFQLSENLEVYPCRRGL